MGQIFWVLRCENGRMVTLLSDLEPATNCNYSMKSLIELSAISNSYLKKCVNLTDKLLSQEICNCKARKQDHFLFLKRRVIWSWYCQTDVYHHLTIIISLMLLDQWPPPSSASGLHPASSAPSLVHMGDGQGKVLLATYWRFYTTFLDWCKTNPTRYKLYIMSTEKNFPCVGTFSFINYFSSVLEFNIDCNSSNHTKGCVWWCWCNYQLRSPNKAPFHAIALGSKNSRITQSSDPQWWEIRWGWTCMFCFLLALLQLVECVEEFHLIQEIQS